MVRAQVGQRFRSIDIHTGVVLNTARVVGIIHNMAMIRWDKNPLQSNLPWIEKYLTENGYIKARYKTCKLEEI